MVLNGMLKILSNVVKCWIHCNKNNTILFIQFYKIKFCRSYITDKSIWWIHYDSVDYILNQNGIIESVQKFLYFFVWVLITLALTALIDYYSIYNTTHKRFSSKKIRYVYKSLIFIQNLATVVF